MSTIFPREEKAEQIFDEILKNPQVLAFCPFGTAALKINAAALNERINCLLYDGFFSFAVVRQNGLVIIGERRPLLLV